jgi:hypothetical protein
VTSWDDQEQLFLSSITAVGRLDIAVINAGISGPDPIYADDGKPLALHIDSRQFYL